MAWAVEVIRHGDEQQPVVVIDGFAEASRFVEDAEFLAFRPIGPHYPGVRAVVSAPMMREPLTMLAPVAAEVFGVQALSVVDSFYSLVTTPAAALAPIQRLPHFDEVSPQRLALLHFLSRDETSGTAFYRHRATGFESIDAARLPAYRAALDADLARHGVPEPGYIGGSTAVFEQLAVHAGSFNRAILYRSNTLHCAHIPSSMTLSSDPAEGRLTVNTFLDSKTGYGAVT